MPDRIQLDDNGALDEIVALRHGCGRSKRIRRNGMRPDGSDPKLAAVLFVIVGLAVVLFMLVTEWW